MSLHALLESGVCRRIICADASSEFPPLRFAGWIVGARGDHYFLHPQFKDDPRHKAFVKKFKDSTGAYPIYPVYHMVQALEGLKEIGRAHV